MKRSPIKFYTGSWLLSKLILITSLVTSFFLFSPQSSSAATCESAVKIKTAIERKKLWISKGAFNRHTHALRATLDGNLMTVWRSEWKEKLSVQEANQMVETEVKILLPPDQQQAILANLDNTKESFTRTIHERLARTRQSLAVRTEQAPGSIGNTASTDALRFTVRDAPPPTGAMDTTFTYYLEPLRVKGNQGKIQPRIRNYIRAMKTAMLKRLNIGDEIPGRDASGNSFIIKKLEDDKFYLGPLSQTGKTYTFREFKKQFGSEMRFYAPHGGRFKLEIKIALNDRISKKKFKNLGGKHMVQKLDVSLTPEQVNFLFSPLKTSTESDRREEALSRLIKLQTELIEKNPAKEDRVIAVLDVLRTGISLDANYLEIQGATFYHRSAFESSLGFFFTVDRMQQVYYSDVYTSTGESTELQLKEPMKIIAENPFREAKPDDARHVEFKMAYNAVDEIVGLEFDSPESLGDLPSGPVNPELEKALIPFAAAAKNNQHRGKFNYLRKHGHKAIPQSSADEYADDDQVSEEFD